MTVERPSILLCWGYDRAGWIAPFEALADRFEFTYVHHIVPPPGEVRRTAQRVVYWSDDASARRLLERVAPSRVLFMSISSGRSVALNVAARDLGIPTYVMDHGIASPMEAYEALYKQAVAEGPAPTPEGGGGRATLGYIARSLSPRSAWQMPLVAAYFAAFKLRPWEVSRRWTYGRFRRPDRFISFSRRNAAYYEAVYRAREHEVEPIGIPEFDPFFRKSSAAPSDTAYAVLIDTGLVETQSGVSFISREEMATFYRKLNDYCVGEGLRLKVKLHPESYGRMTWRPQHPNIDWIEATDVAALVHGASQCFSFHSTLMLPVIHQKPTYLIRLNPMPELDELEALGVARVLDARSFDPRQIDFGRIVRSGPAFDRFVREFLHAADGRSTERLAEVLRHGHVITW